MTHINHMCAIKCIVQIVVLDHCTSIPMQPWPFKLTQISLHVCIHLSVYDITKQFHARLLNVYINPEYAITVCMCVAVELL